MKKILSIIFIIIFSVFLSSESINLVEIQKKEKERRKKTSKSKYVISNDNIVKFSLKESRTYVKSEGNEEVDSGEAPTEKSKEVKTDEKDTEEYWRGRLKIINDSIDDLKSRIQETQSQLNRESSNFLVASIPSLQQQIKENIDNLTRQLDELKANLEQTEAEKEAFFTEARRAGALPGWLR